jgi:hypothetical protein
MRTFLCRLTVWACAAVLLSCDGDKPGPGSGSGSCTGVTPCGGTLTGSWEATSTCVTGTEMFEDCPDSTLDSSGMKFVGTVTFADDMSYTSTIHTEGTLKLIAPVACLEKNFDLNCAEFQVFFSILLGEDGSISCSGTDTCSCSMTFMPKNPNASQTGAWETLGTRLTMTPSSVSADSEEWDYCVQPTQLNLKTPVLSSMMQAMGAGPVHGFVVLKKK